MRSLFSALILFLLFSGLHAQSCNNGPFPGHNFQLSAPYTLANGHVGVAVLYRNDNAIWNPIDLQGLVLAVSTNSCSSCGQIDDAFVTSFRSVGGTATVAADHHSASFGWNGVPSGQHFPLVDNEVVMVLDLGGQFCNPASCFDLHITVSFMFANGANVPANQIATCDREICKDGFMDHRCDATYGGPSNGPSPYSQPTLSPSDDVPYFGGVFFLAIQYWDAGYDCWNILSASPICITGVHFKVVVSGDLQIAGYTSPSFPGATVSFTADQLTFDYFGTGQMICNSDIFLWLHFVNNHGCGSISLCEVLIQTCKGEMPLANLTWCRRTLCLGTDGHKTAEPVAATMLSTKGAKAFPNPFGEKTQVNFNLQQASKVTFGVYSAAGQLIYHEVRDCMEGENSFQFAPGSDVASGVYFYTLQTAEGTVRGKLIKE